MSAFRIAVVLLIILGGVIMTITAVRYSRLLRQMRQESYGGIPLGTGSQIISLLVMLFFIAGFVVGALDVIRRDVEPIYLFVAIVFFVGALFIAALVQAQILLVRSLRNKTMDVMRGFVNSIEMKDPYTQGHSWHVYYLTMALFDHLPPKARQTLNKPKLLDAALLHDVGKMGVPDGILKKKGPLTEEEWQAVRTHTRYGTQMLENTCFAEIGDWVLYHHERMDGAGYLGLPGEQIPLAARIIALADTYSAMATDREYRPKRSHARAVEILREVAGTQLDSELVAVFCAIPEDELTGLIDQALRETRAKDAPHFPPHGPQKPSHPKG